MPFGYTQIRSRTQWAPLVESIAIAILGFVACFYSNPTDFFFINGSFSWIIIAPILVALFYGFIYGVISQIVIIAAGLFFQPDLRLSYDFGLFLFGSSALIALCGQFGSYMKQRIAHIGQLNYFLRERLDAMSRAYYFLKCSHDTIEQQFVMQPVSLRSTFQSIQELMHESQNELSPIVMQRLIDILALYCQIQKAQFYLMEDGKLSEKSIARIGGESPINPNDDHLVRVSLESESITYLSIADYDDEFDSEYIVVAPIVTSSGDILGLLLIEEIAFSSMNIETLEQLMVLLTYFSSLKVLLDSSDEIRRSFPDCPTDFAKEMIQLANLKKQYHIDSTLTLIVIARNDKTQFFIDNLNARKRTLDEIWVHDYQNIVFYWVLMPLTKPESALGYIERMKRNFLENYNMHLSSHKLYFYYHEIEDHDPVQFIQRIIESTLTNGLQHESFVDVVK